MRQLSDYIVISDMDGTLLGPDSQIPPRNTEAIRRFVAAGGRFGIATGRSRGFMRELAQQLPINAPCVLYNGGVLYDYAADKLLSEVFLPPSAAAFIKDIAAEMPDIGTLVIRGDTYYEINEEKAFAEFFETRSKSYYRQAGIDELGGDWYKALFQITEDRYDAFFALVGRKAYPGVRFVSTNPTLIEMLPAESSKGAALEKLIAMGLVERENLVAIGDFYNDLEMIELAGLGVTLRTSPADIREKADLVVGDCANGAVADLIEHLESLCARE